MHTRGDLHSIGIGKLARPSPSQDPLCGRDVPTAQDGEEMEAAVMASLKTELGSVKLSSLNRERLIEFVAVGRHSQQGRSRLVRSRNREDAM